MANTAGRVVFLTTHSMEEADVLGDRVAIMAHGRIQALGTPVARSNRLLYGQHRRPVARSNRLLYGQHRRPVARSNRLLYGQHRRPLALKKKYGLGYRMTMMMKQNGADGYDNLATDAAAASQFFSNTTKTCLF